MTNPNTGCLHDYTLTTSDLKKIETADVVIMNGLGIENFSNKITQNYSEIKIINASENIGKLLEDDNAHVWLSIDKYINQVDKIEQGLIKYDAIHTELYEKNANEYKRKLEELKNKIKEETTIKKKCISFSESLAYLAETMNLDILTIETDHEQNGLSAEKLANTIEYVKNNNIKNIIIDKQTAQDNAKTVANEIGASIYVVDSILSGEYDINTYIKIMEENLKIVESMK